MDQSIAYYTGRFVGIPLLIALAVFIVRRIKTSTFDHLFDVVERKEKVLFFSIITAYFLTFATLSVLRYLSLHSTLLDLGIYDNKIWRIARFGEFSYCIDGHLRPIIILFAPLYMLLASPVVILVIQTAMITLGESVSPVARIALLPIIGKTTKGMPM